MLYQWLHYHSIKIIIEHHIAYLLNLAHYTTLGNLNQIGKQADLAIIIGGDGSMLRAAHVLFQYDIKIIGINLGTIGFLADLNPNSVLTELSKILNGNFINEKRFLLDVSIKNNNNLKKIGTAINEVILHTNTTGKMIAFDLYIDNNFICFLRADGFIISTPTGSTAYSLSAGGPILNPAVNAIILIPICPHSLSCRPIIIENKSIISLKFPKIAPKLKIGLDNKIPIDIYNKKKILIQRSTNYLHLIHPNSYNYFKNLKIKLGWAKNLIRFK